MSQNKNICIFKQSFSQIMRGSISEMLGQIVIYDHVFIIANIIIQEPIISHDSIGKPNQYLVKYKRITYGMVCVRPFPLTLEVFSHDAILYGTPFFVFKTITKGSFIQLETKPRIQVSYPSLNQYQSNQIKSNTFTEVNLSRSKTITVFTNLSLVCQELGSSWIERIELVTSGKPSSSSAKPRRRLLRAT